MVALSVKCLNQGYHHLIEAALRRYSIMATRMIAVLMVSGLAYSLPILQDSLEVGSSLSEVRVEAPAGLDLETAATHGGDHQSHGGSHHGDVGYLRTKASKGNNGYQHFDSFHKKDGDKYGFEKHSAFGKKSEGGDGDSHHEGSSYSEDDGGKGGSYGGSYSSGGDGDHYGAASSDIGKYAQADDNENAGTGEYSSYDDGGSSEHYSGGGGGGGGEHYGGGEGGGSYHGGESHYGGGEGGGEGDHHTEYSEGDKENGSYGSSYKTGSSYGDEYTH